jgi:ATP-binding cassette subfamily C (CFTR/MRP) protein 1
MNNTEETNQNETPEHMTPYAEAGWWSHLTFGWAEDMLQQANRGEKFTVKDFGKVPEELQNHVLADRIESHYNNSTNKNFLWSFFMAIKGRIGHNICYRLADEGLCILCPLLINKILTFLTDQDPDTAYGFKLLALFVLVKKVQSFIMFQQWTYGVVNGNKSTQAVKLLVGKKIQKMTQSTNKKYDSGAMRSLVDDCGKIWGSFHMISDFITMGPQLICKFVILYNMIGNFTFIAIALSSITTYLVSYLETLNRNQDKKKNKVRDERTNLVTEVLSNIKTVKFYSWVDHYENEIDTKRQEEQKEI